MISLVLGALRERRAQTVALLLLTVLAALGGSAAPWFQDWANRAVAEADVAAAPLSQRLVTVTGSIRYSAGEPAPSARLRQAAAAALPIAGTEAVVSMTVFSSATRPGQAIAAADPLNLTLGYRDDICAHVAITGTCPTAPGQVLFSRRIADRLGVQPGDQVNFAGLRLAKGVNLTVTGLYEVEDLASPYWAAVPRSLTATSRALDESAYVTEAGATALGADGFDLAYQLILPPDQLAQDPAGLRSTLTEAARQLRPSLSLQTVVDGLLDRIKRDQSLVSTGVLVAGVQLVLLCWFALYLAVRYTADVRRPDIGLLKLRGSASWRVWTLTALPSAVPMVAGALLGWALGRVAALVLGGFAGGGTDPSGDLVVSAAVAAAIGVGAFVVCLAAEARALRSPVASLLRRVPARRRGWRTDIGDLLVVVLAIAGIYQGYAELGGEPSVFSMLAPGLVGLAVGIVAARGLPFVAAASGAAALRSGRAGTALTALHVARRPGTQRVFAVVAVAVAVLTSTLFFARTADDAWGRRAAAELGAARVVTVRAENSSVLLSGVRAVDPAGRYAMAVVRGTGLTASDRVIAVDTSRLAAVALLPEEWGLPDGATLAHLLHPAPVRSIEVHDGPITVDAQASGAAPLRLLLQVVDPAGAWHTVAFGPLATGRASTTAVVSGCANGCRLASLAPVAPGGVEATLDLYGLAQAGRPVVSADQFADITAWRPSTAAELVGPRIATGPGELSLSVYNGLIPRFVQLDSRVFVAGAPVPIPVAVVGSLDDQTSRAGDSRLTALGSERLAYSVVATGSVMPRLGDEGALVDLEYAQLSAAGPSESVTMEVWLAADAPQSIVDSLAGHGIQVISSETLDGLTDRLRHQGPGVALRFQLFAAIVLLLTAAGTVVVAATVERRARADELAALRAQGLPDRTMRWTVYGATGLLAAVGVLVGLLGALVAQAVVATTQPVFSDTWTLLPVREGPWLGPAVVAVAAALVGLGVAAAAGATRTVRTVRARLGGTT